MRVTCCTQIQTGELQKVKKMTYSELRGQVARFAAALKSHGIKIGDRVTGYMPNCIETVIAMLATASIGMAPLALINFLYNRMDAATNHLCVVTRLIKSMRSACYWMSFLTRSDASNMLLYVYHFNSGSAQALSGPRHRPTSASTAFSIALTRSTPRSSSPSML